jgi:hypothetical protein
MGEPIIDPQQNNRLIVTLPLVDQVAVGQHMLGHGDGFPPGHSVEPPSQVPMIPTRRRKAARRNRARDISQSL